MKILLIVLSLFSAPAFADSSIQTLTIPTSMRFVWGSEVDGITNLFRGVGGDKKMDCSLNLSLPGPSLAKAFERGHDYQVFYTARYDVELGITEFTSQIVPYSYEYCAEYSDSQDPEDTECLRYETARGLRSVFTYDLVAFRMEGTLACLNNDVSAGTKAFSEQEAADFLRRNLVDIKLR